MIRKYDHNEIQTVLQSYEKINPDINDKAVEIANRLFIATISGDKKARQYFHEFKNKYKILDGAYKEEYDDLKSILELWDRKEE